MSTVPSLPLTIGSGRYELRRHLGGGYFGNVFEGWDFDQDMQVAIKLFGATTTPDAVILEARVQTRLSDHRNVVAIRNVVAEPPRPFTVMDFCRHGSVAGRAQTASMVEAVQWTRDALAGLGHAHSLGIVHRDVKPANWLLQDDERAAVGDFGLSEDTVKAFVVSSVTYLPHAAPEVIAGGTSSPAGDVWAAGCSLYRLLTGRYPFNDPAAASTGSYEPVHRLNRQIPMSLSRVIDSALTIDPAVRPDALDLASVLARAEIRHSWHRIADPDSVERWTAASPAGDFSAFVRVRPRAGVEVVVTCDRGSGPRRVRSERVSSEARGLQQLRTWLVEFVHTGRL
jgi:serine/threonine protein kinase